MTTSASEFDIAVIGAACRLPGASSLDAYWENLVNGVNSIQQFSIDELLAAGVSRGDIDSKHYVKAAPIIEDSARFDASFFGYTPKDAELMDPQHRHILELSWQAFEDASIVPGDNQERTAVYAGSAFNSYVLATALKDNYYQDWLPTLLGADKDFQATRVAFKLGLTGPAMSVQTACSTSLVAIHMACQTLISQEIDQALVAAASIRCPVVRGYMYEPGGVMSPDGICRPFDAAAAGTVFGSGAGAVLLKRLSDAVADGDPIKAVIKGSAINNDGASKSDFTAPTIYGQAQVITEALGSADLSADEISYVEAHGTGTSIGDPIEVAALTKAFRRDTEDNQYCYLGSVKSNIGHLDVAAGMASFLKVVLALQNKKLPPCLNYRSANPQIDFPATPFRIIEQVEPWTAKPDSLRTAGVTSLGMGGTNAHIILQEYPSTNENQTQVERIPTFNTSNNEVGQAPSENSRDLTLLPLSTKDDLALSRRSWETSEFLNKNKDQINLSDVVTTLVNGRKIMPCRQVTVVQDIDTATERLLDNANVYSVQSTLPIREREIIFMFPGQGSQVLGMGNTLYKDEPVYRDAINQVAAVVDRYIDHRLLAILFAEDASPLAALIHQTQYTQPCLFAVQYAYVALLESWGVTPSAVIGHSIGEYVAAVVAGVITLETGAKIVTERGRLMQLAAPGAMSVVQASLSSSEVQLPDSLDLAVINAADSYVVAGDFEAIEPYEKSLSEANIRFTRLATSHAFHSRMMESVLPAFTQFVANEKLSKPQLPIISNVSGDWLLDSDCVQPEYWASQLRNTVLFDKGLSTILSRGDLLAVECGAGNTLSSLLNHHKEKKSNQLAFSCAPPKRSKLNEAEAVRLTLGALWCNGQAVELPQADRKSGRRVSLPSYPFVGDSHWFKSANPSVCQSVEANTATNSNNIRLKQDHWIQETTWSWLPNKPQSSGFEKAPILGIGADADWCSDQLDGLLSGMCEISDIQAFDSIPHLLIAWPESESEQSSVQLLLTLIQGLTKFDGVQEIKMDILTRGASGCLGSDVVQTSGSMAAAIALVTKREWPHIKIQTIDMPWKPTAEDWGLLAQQMGVEGRPTVTAVRHGQFWERLTRAVDCRIKSSKSFFNEKGAIALVGGFGGIGKALGSWLASQKVPLILTYRPTGNDELSPERIQWVEHLREKGALVNAVELQPDDKNSTEKFTHFLSQQYIATTAVIYLAGAVDDALIPMQNSGSLSHVMDPKVTGVNALISAINTAKISTKLVLFSSTAAWHGPVGQFNYASANAYLMGLSATSQREYCELSTIAWPGWIDTGMLTSVKDQRTLDAIRHEGITVEQGIEILIRFLNTSLRSAWVSPVALGFLPSDSEVASPLSIAQEDGAVEIIETKNLPNEINSNEGRVTSHWQELLGSKNLTSTQDYFDIGGTSLVALKLCSRIERDFGVEFTIEDLMAAPTIAQQTLLITQRLEANGIAEPLGDELYPERLDVKAATSDDRVNAATFNAIDLKTSNERKTLARENAKCLVQLQVIVEKQTEIPVYLVHAHGGMVVGYQKLARALGKHRPVFGLQAQGVRGESPPLSTIEAMADRYAEEILTHSEGPCIIGGYCMGGTIAWEVASKLQSQGREVKMIMMIQSFHRDLNYPIVQNGKTLYPAGTPIIYRISLVKDKFVEVVKRNMSQTGFSLETITRIMKGAATRLKRTIDKRIDENITQNTNHDLNEIEDGALLSVHKANGDAFMLYSPGKVDIPVAFYSAHHQPVHVRNDYTLGFQFLAEGWTSVQPIEGSFLQGLDGLDFEQISANLETDLNES